MTHKASGLSPLGPGRGFGRLKGSVEKHAPQDTFVLPKGTPRLPEYSLELADFRKAVGRGSTSFSKRLLTLERA